MKTTTSLPWCISITLLAGCGTGKALVEESSTPPSLCEQASCDEHATCDDAQGTAVCTCWPGYIDARSDGSVCDDPDGCAAAPCFPGVLCDDVPAPGAGFVCGNCPSGYEGDGDSCADIDGCSDAPCYPDVACTDVAAPYSGFTCGQCPEGLVGDGIQCVAPVDCTADPGVCGAQAECVDAGDGSSRCVCNAGYSGDGVACTDADGCATNPCFPTVACHDVPAPGTGFSCGDCPVGYEGNGELCSDVDGCIGSPCFAGVTCTDVPAPGTGFVCGDCPSGYEGDGEVCTLSPVAPLIASFSATPSSVTAGVPADVVWSWTYASSPTPAPTCSIDHDVGAMTSGSSSSVTLQAATELVLTCSNAAGSHTATTSIAVTSTPVAPQIATFAASPTSVTSGVPTEVTWSWTYANSPTPAPTCSIDHDVGPVTSSSRTNVTLTESTQYVLTCSNSAGSHTASTSIVVTPVPVAPQIDSFAVSPSSVTSGASTAVTWTWTYASSPTPAPTCSINQGVGSVTSGSITTITLSDATDFVLTCSNSAGSHTATASVAVTPVPVAPQIDTFSASPSSVTVGVPTTVTWSWTYVSAPTPAPTCSIDRGVGTLTSGSSTSVTLATGTEYVLTCSNAAGSHTKRLSITAVPAAAAPEIATFSASRSSVPQGVSTSVTWSWTYSNTPTPAPTCAIDNGVGSLTSGGTRALLIETDTLFTLTCTNTAGSRTSTKTITVSQAAPQDLYLTAWPSSVVQDVATTVTFSWGFGNTPAPPPSCTLTDVGDVTGQSVASASVTLHDETTYTVACANVAGEGSASVTIPVLLPGVATAIRFNPSSYQTNNQYACVHGVIEVVDATDTAVPAPSDQTITFTAPSGVSVSARDASCGGFYTTTTIPAGSSSTPFSMWGTVKAVHTVTASSTSLDGASTTFTVGDPYCLNPPPCIPSGHTTCGSCSKCCSGVCSTVCY